jgi:hypothetical protein
MRRRENPSTVRQVDMVLVVVLQEAKGLSPPVQVLQRLP